MVLYNVRKEAMEQCGCYTEKIEGCLWQIYVRQLAYILDNRSIIEEKIRNNGITDDGLDD
jgi:hypothetical protein